MNQRLARPISSATFQRAKCTTYVSEASDPFTWGYDCRRCDGVDARHLENGDWSFPIEIERFIASR